MSRKHLNILFIASEAEPFVKIGGLGDVAGSLPHAIRHLSNEDIAFDIRLVLPYYGVIKKNFPQIKKFNDFSFHTGSLSFKSSLHEIVLNGIPVYFIDGLPIKEEDPVYGSNFVADAEKFFFFSLACLELPRVLKWKVDILHANDWHTSIAVHQLAKLKGLRTEFSKIKSVITLHNLAYMGAGSEFALAKFGIEPAEDSTLPVWARTIPLPMGLSSANRIIPVSPSYAQEILTPEYGCGLENFFGLHQDRISGILNGIDNSLWDPAKDPSIAANFNSEDFRGKETCKRSLEKEMSFTNSDHIPLIILISRMDQQKGVDLAIGALRQLADQKWHAVILGSGDPMLEKAAKALESQMTEKVRVKIQFDTTLSHRLYAGADILLMPSRYEPCGLAQLIAMRYGTIPVVNATGGLKDTVSNSSEGVEATGFLSSEANVEQFTVTLKKALQTYDNLPVWKRLIHYAMTQDYSWVVSAKKYCSLYQELTTQN